MEHVARPPFTVRSIVKYCWGMTLNLSHVTEQSALGDSFNSQFFKAIENLQQPPQRTQQRDRTFLNDLTMRMAKALRTMAISYHVKIIITNIIMDIT